MGEYILLAGRHYKIGTCEDLFWCRYSDLAEWIQTGRASKASGNKAPADYLAGAFRFRFPFPDEDGDNQHARLAGYDVDYNRGVLLPYPAELLTADIQHYGTSAEVLRWDGVRVPGIRALVKLPCPLAAGGARLQVQVPDSRIWQDSGPWVELVQQRPLDGALWPIFRCPWCRTRWRVEREEAERIAVHALATAPDLQLDELMRRMLAGYDGPPAGGA